MGPRQDLQQTLIMCLLCAWLLELDFGHTNKPQAPPWALCPEQVVTKRDGLSGSTEMGSGPTDWRPKQLPH